MVDIWLIFAQIVPFVQVLLHTLIDSQRIEENREINHHGKSISVNIAPKEFKEGKASNGIKEEGSASNQLFTRMSASLLPQVESPLPGVVRDSRLIDRNEESEV